MYHFCNIYFSLKLYITRGIERLSHISTEFTFKRAIEVYLILSQLCSRDSRYSEYVPRSQYTKILHVSGILTLFRMGFFGAAQEWERGGGKYPSSLKSVTHILQWWKLAQLYLTQRRSKKYINHVTHPLSSADISIFSPKISKFCYIKKYRYRLHFDT